MLKLFLIKAATQTKSQHRYFSDSNKCAKVTSQLIVLALRNWKYKHCMVSVSDSLQKFIISALIVIS